MKNFLHTHRLLRSLLYLLLAIPFLLLIYKCPFDFFLGISCPGCGMTRALFALLRFDLRLAFYYHPGIFLVVPGTLLWFLDFIHLFHFKKNTKKVLLTLGSTALILIYLIRLCRNSEIVSIHIERGLIWQVYQTIRSHLLH